jgi:hypothetical protein
MPHTDFNSAIIYTPGGLFTKDKASALVVGLDKVLVAEIEKQLGLGPLPGFDKNGNELKDFRKDMEDRAQSRDDNRLSHAPVTEAATRLDQAHEP